MKKTRTLASGRTVTINDNDGIRKRCDCARRKWATCPHSWFFSFKWGEVHHRFPVDRQANKHIADRADAKHLADNWRCEIREGTFVLYKQRQSVPPALTPASVADVTFGAFAAKWRERGVSRKRGRNKGRKQSIARAELSAAMQANDRAICTRLGNLPIDGKPLSTRPIGLVTGDDLEQAFGQLRGLAGSTWNKYLDVVRMMQTWGVRKGYLARPWFDDNDADAIITRQDSATRERRLQPDVCDEGGNVIREGEARKLLAAAGPWLQRLILAALETGFRCGELLSLTWADVDLSHRTLTIQAENAKSAKKRQIPIHPRLLAVLKHMRHDPAGNEHPRSAFVFGNSIGERMAFPKKQWDTVRLRAHGHEPQWSGGKLSQTSRVLLKQIDLHFHDLRHEAGSRWSDAGWPLAHVQRMLGHANPEMTANYINNDVRQLRASMRMFENVQPLHDVAQTAEIDPQSAVQQSGPTTSKVVVN